MKNKKTIMVSINGREGKVYEHQANRSHYSEQIDNLNNQTSSAQKFEEQSFPTKGKQYPHKSIFYIFRNIKPFFLAALSAIVIGSLLGFSMLMMFKGSDDQSPHHINAIKQNDDQVKENDHEKKSEVSDVNIPSLNAYVLQGGVFSETENAEHWSMQYNEAGFRTVIWERDGQYYLFSGVASTKDFGQNVAEKQDDFDVYIKEWLTNPETIQLSKEEIEWVSSFQEKWKETVQSVSEENNILIDQWNQLMNFSSFQSDYIREFYTELKKLLDNESIIDDPVEQQYFLLASWYEFEKSIVRK